MAHLTVPPVVPPIPALQTLVFEPSNATPPPGVFNDFDELMAYRATVGTPVRIQFVEPCTIPGNVYTFEPFDRFVALGFNQVLVQLADGCELVNLAWIDEGVQLESLSSAPIITKTVTDVGIQIFRIGDRCAVKASGTAPFFRSEMTLDTGIFVVVCDVNATLLEGASPVLEVDHVSGANPAAVVVTAIQAAIIQKNTIATAAPGEFAFLQLQQIGFDQAEFNLEQGGWDSSLGPIAASQTYIASPGFPLKYAKVTSNHTLEGNPYQLVFADTTGGNVTVTQLVPIASVPNGALWGVGNAGGGNVARAAPAAGSGDTVNGLAIDDLPNAGEVRFYMADHEAQDWKLVFAANQTAATPPPPSTTDVQVFTSNGTWADPGAKAIRVIAIGGGGGGGGGACASPGSERSGGGGGGAGGLVIADFAAGEWGASESVQVGVGGAGGAGGVSSGSNGAPGNYGGVTTFGSLLKAGSGGPGGAGENGVDAAGGSGAFETSVAGMDPYSEGSFKSNWGGRSHRTTVADWGYSGGPLPGGGGGGGGLDSTDTAQTAGNGGLGSVVAGPAGIPRGNAGVTGGAPPTNGGSGASLNACGGGGGGGAASDDDTITAQSGANGGLYGGGGGGGGAAIAGGTADAGAGGNGADGLCVVISYL